MWKFHLILAIAFALLVSVGFASDITSTVEKVAKDYRVEQGFVGQCYVDGQPVGLDELLYGLGVAEGGFKPGSAGLRTNNPGSLRKGMGLKKVINTHNIDNAKARPEYATMYDGLYEKAHLIASPDFRYKCNYNLETAFAYVNGPRAERTKEKIQNAKNHIYNAKSGIKRYKTVKGITIGGGTTTPVVEKGCKYVGKIKKGQRVQVDLHVNGNFIDVLLNWIFGKDEGDGIIFVCTD